MNVIVCLNRIRRHPLLHFFEASECDIIYAICKLSATNSCSYDGISAVMLKSTGHVLASVLAHLVNVSFHTETFPAAFKHAIVVPIFKTETQAWFTITGRFHYYR